MGPAPVAERGVATTPARVPPVAAAEPVARADGPALLLLGVLVGAMVAGRLETALGCALLALLALAPSGARAPRAAWWRGTAFAMGLALVLNAVLTPGGRRLALAPLPLAVTTAGLENGALLALRLLGASLALLALAARWPGGRAADEIARLLQPLERLRVPVRAARETLALALRFVPLLTEEARRVARLQDLRAGRPPRGPLEWMARRRAIAVPTLVNALERAERVSLALEARHWRLRPLPARRRAMIAWPLAGTAVAAVALLWRG